MCKRLSRSLTIAPCVLFAVAGCESPVTLDAGTEDVGPPLFDLHDATASIQGIYTGVVTDARDLNQASFGRSASDWVGRELVGTFSIDLTAPGIGDRDANPYVWALGPVPGPGPFVEFVTVTALIDGEGFRTSRADFQTVFFGDVALIGTESQSSFFRPQDSFVGSGPMGGGRSIVGFDAFYGPGGVSFDGTTLTIDPDVPFFGFGAINDLMESGGVAHRDGNIGFRLTSLSVTTMGGLLGRVIALAAGGALDADKVAALSEKLGGVEAKKQAGQNAAACGQLGAFVRQVRAFMRSAQLSDGQGQPLVDDAERIQRELGC